MSLTARISGTRVRLRLTLLYSVLFLLSGAVLLAITYVLVTQGGSSVGMSTFSSSPSGDQSISNIILGNGGPGSPPLTGSERRLVEAAQQQAARQHAEFGHQLLVKSGIALAIMSVISAALGWLVAGRVLRPVRTMTDSIQLISARNVHERLAFTGPGDELKALADTVDGLLGRLETALDSHKRFVANAAHELRTPLTVEHALLEEAMLDPDATVDSYRARFEDLVVVSEQQAQLLESLLVLATSERGLDRLESVDLSELAGSVLGASRPRACEQDVAVVTRIRPARVTGDPALVERLVANLVDNAMSYNVPDGWVEVATGTADGGCFLSVTNTGPPVPPEMVDRLLNPFQRLARTADDGHHGLGLSIVQSIAVSHSADLSVRARPEGGLAIRVDFPAEKSPAISG
ncbi:HAMP domain-containing histidine kinase [Plantactinospora sp. S1510]|uniref:histidine kinase n=1 Tax=Plantactinospora alkalitolerans TaxID=2789879 RepID=A0ABS0GRC3_9ACTN|nr:HAMP domain-containing sensor histidine kinase [Plantactinospora alkalitolerans]MBF9128741.1 HAMP domain-containing histidine kinase [Plantactinospora alkalitolerans]